MDLKGGTVMRRIGLIVVSLVLFTVPAFAQQAPQVTSEDLLKMLGLCEVQKFQLGKTLDGIQQELAKVKSEREAKDTTHTQEKK